MNGEPIYNQAFVLQSDWKGKLKKAASISGVEEVTFDQEFDDGIQSLPEGLIIPKEGTFQRLIHDFATRAGWHREKLGQILGILRITVSGFMCGNVIYTQDYVTENKWKEKLKAAAPDVWRDSGNDFEKEFDEKITLLPDRWIIPNEGTFQRVIHDFAVKASWDRNKLGEVLGIFGTEVSAFMSGRVTYARYYIVRKDWAGKLKRAESKIWMADGRKFEKDFNDKLRLLPEGLLVCEEGSLEYLLHGFALKAGWTRIQLAVVLGIDNSMLTKFLSGIPLYTQAYIIENGWVEKLRISAPQIYSFFEKDFDAVMIPESPVLIWREAASEFVMRLLDNLHCTTDSVIERIPRNAPPVVKNQRNWDRIAEIDAGLAKTVYRDAIRALCGIANMDLENPYRPFERQAVGLIESVDRA